MVTASGLVPVSLVGQGPATEIQNEIEAAGGSDQGDRSEVGNAGGIGSGEVSDSVPVSLTGQGLARIYKTKSWETEQFRLWRSGNWTRARQAARRRSAGMVLRRLWGRGLCWAASDAGAGFQAGESGASDVKRRGRSLRAVRGDTE